MKYWALEVPPGEEVKVELGGRLLRLRQGSLGTIDWKKQGSVSLLANGKKGKIVIGTLDIGKRPLDLFGWVFVQDFTISHTWRDGSVFLSGGLYRDSFPATSSKVNFYDDEEEETTSTLTE